MALTFIPGYQAEMTLNLVDIGIFGNVLNVRRAKNAPGKAVFGSQQRKTISGIITGGFSANGHVAASGPIASLFTAFELETPVAYDIQIGESGGATDGGTLTGNCILTGLDITTDAEGEWEWSISADFDGDVTHTPAA